MHMRLLQLNALFNPLFYPPTEFDLHEVIQQMTAHYIRGIATPGRPALRRTILTRKDHRIINSFAYKP